MHLPRLPLQCVGGGLHEGIEGGLIEGLGQAPSRSVAHGASSTGSDSPFRRIWTTQASPS
jgi:hypothetical protein